MCLNFVRKRKSRFSFCSTVNYAFKRSKLLSFDFGRVNRNESDRFKALNIDRRCLKLERERNSFRTVINSGVCFLGRRCSSPINKMDLITMIVALGIISDKSSVTKTKRRSLLLSDSYTGSKLRFTLYQGLKMPGSITLTLQSTAEILNINKSYLATLFKKETGETFTGYVNMHRMDHAIFLLNTSTEPIQSIADACGIPDAAYFTKMFRQEKGMTPGQYRKMIRN